MSTKSSDNIIGVVCVGALRNQKVNEVAIIRDGHYDEDTNIFWCDGVAFVLPGGDLGEARKHSITYSAHGLNGAEIWPLTAEYAYPCKAA